MKQKLVWLPKFKV